MGPHAVHPHSGSAWADRSPGDRAYAWAWLSLALYAVSGVAAFVVGEGLATLLDATADDAELWRLAAAAGPALVVFALPVGVTWWLAARAKRLGRPDARVATLVSGLVAAGFAGLNIVSYLVGRVAG
ncbi:MAG: hypothetical protein R2731_18175 [Nocardioides sp.]